MRAAAAVWRMLSRCPSTSLGSHGNAACCCSGPGGWEPWQPWCNNHVL